MKRVSLPLITKHDICNETRLFKGMSLSLDHSKTNKRKQVSGPANGRNARQKKPGLTSTKKQRIFVSHEYVDLFDAKPSESEMQWVCVNVEKGLNKQVFAFKLHKALEDVERDGLAYAFSWLPHGRAFKVHDREVFQTIILPRYMAMTNYASYLRQCSIYNFRRLTSASGNRSCGAAYHASFLRGRLFLCSRMARTTVKGTSVRPAANFCDEPDFFSMPFCTLSTAAFGIHVFEHKPFVLLTDDDEDDDVMIEETKYSAKPVTAVTLNANNMNWSDVGSKPNESVTADDVFDDFVFTGKERTSFHSLPQSFAANIGSMANNKASFEDFKIVAINCANGNDTSQIFRWQDPRESMIQDRSTAPSSDELLAAFVNEAL